MRIPALAAAVLLASAATAAASPASVSVRIGPELQAKATSSLGVREVNDLAAELQRTVEKRLAKTGAYDGARIELVLIDAVPNRPTFRQLADSDSLSYQSFGLGGARIEGRAVAPSGAVTPLAYAYYEDDLRQSRNGATWTDAEGTFSRFAYYLGRGGATLARR